MTSPTTKVKEAQETTDHATAIKLLRPDIRQQIHVLKVATRIIYYYQIYANISPSAYTHALERFDAAYAYLTHPNQLGQSGRVAAIIAAELRAHTSEVL